jgi:hypothetical protein
MDGTMEPRLASLVVAVVLALVYVLGTRLDERGEAAGIWRLRRWVSLAAGVSVAYVFVDVLPELGVRHQEFVKEAGEGILFAEQRVYLLALLAFVLLYGLEHMVLASRERHPAAEESAGEGDAVFWIHVGGFALYSWLIGYLLVERAETGRLALSLYGVAMALHFFLVGHSLRETHGRPFDRAGRWVLASSVLLGWLAGVTTELSPVVLARLFAVLAGGVVITSLRAELPGERQGRFWYFSLGAIAYAAVLILA